MRISDWSSDVFSSDLRLIGEKVVMPPSQTTCAVPAEVKAAAGAMMMTPLYAYGPEADFSYPPRPKNAPASWAPDWTARVRYKSKPSLLLGMPGQNGSAPGKEREVPIVSVAVGAGSFKTQQKTNTI